MRGGSLAPRLHSAARVRGDRGRFCARRPKKNRKTLITRTPATSRPGTCARNGRETALYGQRGRPTARRRHHGMCISAWGQPRAAPPLGGAGSRRPRPLLRPPPKNNRETLIAPKTPIEPITGGIWVRPVAARRSANNCDRRTDDTTMEPQDAPRQENREIFSSVRKFDLIFLF